MKADDSTIDDKMGILIQLAQDMPPINYQQVFEKGVQFGWREITDQRIASGDFGDKIKLENIKARLHVQMPIKVSLKELPPKFNTETNSNGPILVLDSTSKFNAQCKAHLKYKIIIGLNNDNLMVNEFKSEDFDITITAVKLLFRPANLQLKLK